MLTRSRTVVGAVVCACACACGGLFASGTALAQASAASAPSARASATAAKSVSLEDYLLLALSPSEGVAVLRGPEGRLVTLRVGGTLGPARARLTQVGADRLRFDVVEGRGERQVAWMIRASNPEQPPQIQRVTLTPPPLPSITGRVAASAAMTSPRPADNK